MIKLTDDATRELLSLRTDDNPHLRVGIKGGGCSGYSYVLGFTNDDGTGDMDNFYTINGVSVIIDKKSALFLDGTTLDYKSENLMSPGFMFNNPNAVKTCGCNKSFS